MEYLEHVKHNFKDGVKSFFLVVFVVALTLAVVGLINNGKKKEELQRRTVILEFDRMRLEDASNILLALQDYQFENRTFPETLEVLKEKDYMDENSRLADPSTKVLYFYQKREQDFVLCIWLSDMIKGVNTASCPSPDSQESL